MRQPNSIADDIAINRLRDKTLEVDFDTGKIYSLLVPGRKGEKTELKGAINADGHIIHGLICNKRRTSAAFAHRIVWIAAHGPIRRGLAVHHVNGNATDNRLANLELVKAEKHIHHGKLTVNEVAEIRTLYATGTTSHAALGKRFGLSRRQIGLIIRNKAWKEN